MTMSDIYEFPVDVLEALDHLADVVSGHEDFQLFAIVANPAASGGLGEATSSLIARPGETAYLFRAVESTRQHVQDVTQAALEGRDPQAVIDAYEQEGRA